MIIWSKLCKKKKHKWAIIEKIHKHWDKKKIKTCLSFITQIKLYHPDLLLHPFYSLEPWKICTSTYISPILKWIFEGFIEAYPLSGRLGEVLGQRAKENDIDWCMFIASLKRVLLWERKQQGQSETGYSFHFKTKNLQGWELKITDTSESEACFEQASPGNQIGPILRLFSLDAAVY